MKSQRSGRCWPWRPPRVAGNVGAEPRARPCLASRARRQTRPQQRVAAAAHAVAAESRGFGADRRPAQGAAGRAECRRRQELGARPDQSDAFATGQPCMRCASSAWPPAIRWWNRRDSLLKTQQPDGSWIVNNEGFNDAPNPDRLARTAVIWNYWGTTSGTIGLARALP